MSRSSIIDHLKELRRRLLISVFSSVLSAGVAFAFYERAIHFLSRPFQSLLMQSEHPFFAYTLFEGFFTKVKLSLLLGVVLASPLLLYQLLRFLLPGLKRVEKKIVFIALFFGLILAGISFYLSYFKLLPFSIAFLTSSDFIPQHVGLVLNYEKSVFFVFNMILYAVILFQFPIVLDILLYLDVLSRKTLLKAGRYIIVLIFVVTAMITPPDLISQVSLAFPLIFLFYLSILVAKCFGWGSDV